tara:strand:+ start:770 stop:1414 length:645 start_codon:yes stop_codon:yes gene_type:complete
MLIYKQQEKPFVFIAVPRTGTTSIHDFLLKVREFGNPKAEKFLSMNYHASMTEIYEKYPHYFNLNRKYYKFAFHRNPWDRMVSAWHEFTENTIHHPWSKALLDYENFETFVTEFKNSEWQTHKNFRPTVWYTHDSEGTQQADFIGQYKNFAHDFAIVCKEIGVSFEQFKNQTIRRQSSTANTNKKLHYKNDKMIQAVADAFEQDIKLFGDKFDE